MIVHHGIVTRAIDLWSRLSWLLFWQGSTWKAGRLGRLFRQLDAIENVWSEAEFSLPPVKMAFIVGSAFGENDAFMGEIATIKSEQIQYIP